MPDALPPKADLLALRPDHLDKKPSGVEAVKRASHGLRGGIAAGLRDDAPTFSDDDANLLKTHGIYQQYDRDTATARKQAGEDKEHMMMARIRPPGGRLTADQYLTLDDLSGQLADSTLRITTRQTFQFHGIAKSNLRALINGANRAMVTTFAACGDVVRNVMTTPAPIADEVHREIERHATAISEHFLPRTKGYFEIWVDGEALSVDAAGSLVDGAPGDDEPIYGAVYLPRKFKIALTHADDNSADVFTNDVGIVALFDQAVDGTKSLRAFTVLVGGGLGMTHNKPATYPRLATPLLTVEPDGLLGAVEAIVKVQRDFGDRNNRKHARLKYLVDDMGIDWIRAQVEAHADRAYADPEPLPRFRVIDHVGWHEQGDGRFYLGVSVPSGRIEDRPGESMRMAFRAIVETYRPRIVLTPNQDILFADVDPSAREGIDFLLASHGVRPAEAVTVFDRFAMACPALPTCGLALTEAERVRTPMVQEIQTRLDARGLSKERIAFRITGCPNGCARPYAGDIGLVGRMPGHYALYVGGDFEGTRLSFRLLDKVAEADVPHVLDVLFARFVAERQAIESFGDWCTRRACQALVNAISDAMPAVSI